MVGAAVATPVLLVTLLIGGGATSTAGATTGTGGVDLAAVPPLAAQMLPLIGEQAGQCPGLPVVWVVAQVQAESGWDPHAWVDNSDGGAAGLYQITEATWTGLGGHRWGVPAHTRPPAGADIYDPTIHLTAGIHLVCGHLKAMTAHLRATGKPVAPLDATLVCHIAGCSRVTGSATGIPTPGEAGCDTGCVQQITAYIASVHRYVTAFTAKGGSPGPVPIGVDLSTLPAPAPYTGPATGCVLPDPTSHGCLTGATAHALAQISTAFGGLHTQFGPVRAAACWDRHPQNPSSDHSRGRACDLVPGELGQYATGLALADGWLIAAWLRAYAGPLHVKYLIWQDRFWSPTSGDRGGWGVHYDGGGVYDIHDPTGGHWDHVHVSIRD